MQVQILWSNIQKFPKKSWDKYTEKPLSWCKKYSLSGVNKVDSKLKILNYIIVERDSVDDSVNTWKFDQLSLRKALKQIIPMNEGERLWIFVVKCNLYFKFHLVLQMLTIVMRCSLKNEKS